MYLVSVSRNVPQIVGVAVTQSAVIMDVGKLARGHKSVRYISYITILSRHYFPLISLNLPGSFLSSCQSVSLFVINHVNQLVYKL